MLIDCGNTIRDMEVTRRASVDQGVDGDAINAIFSETIESEGT